MEQCCMLANFTQPVKSLHYFSFWLAFALCFICKRRENLDAYMRREICAISNHSPSSFPQNFEGRCQISNWNKYNCRVAGMDVDLLGAALLDTKGLEALFYFQKLKEVLLKHSAHNFFEILSAEPMEKLSRQDSRGSVRRTIMEQEKIFRQQLHELHRLYRVQKSLMAELGDKSINFRSTSEETERMVQDTMARLNNSASNSENSQSSHLSEHLFLQECNPGPGMSLLGEETARNPISYDPTRPKGKHKSVEEENCSTCAESDLDLTLSIGQSSCATKTTHWLFAGNKERSSSGRS